MEGVKKKNQGAQPRIERGTCHICKCFAEFSPEATTGYELDKVNLTGGSMYELIPLDH